MKTHLNPLHGIVVGAAVVALAGCIPLSPNLDSQFGNSVNILKAQQTMNPEASQNQDPVSGIDGRAAHEAVDRYQKSFKQPEPQPNVFTIGVGAGGGS